MFKKVPCNLYLGNYISIFSISLYSIIANYITIGNYIIGNYISSLLALVTWKHSALKSISIFYRL